MARFTQTQLNDLRAAIAEGVLRVSANGRSTEFRSLSEMRELERMMSAELEGNAHKPGRIYASFRRA